MSIWKKQNTDDTTQENNSITLLDLTAMLLFQQAMKRLSEKGLRTDDLAGAAAVDLVIQKCWEQASYFVARRPK